MRQKAIAGSLGCEILTIRIEATAACGFGSKNGLKVHLESPDWWLWRGLWRWVSFRDKWQDSCSYTVTRCEIVSKLTTACNLWFSPPTLLNTLKQRADQHSFLYTMEKHWSTAEWGGEMPSVLYLWIDLLQKRAQWGREPDVGGAGQWTLDHRRSLTRHRKQEDDKEEKQKKERKKERKHFKARPERQAGTDSNLT